MEETEQSQPTKLPSEMNAQEFQDFLEMQPDHKELSEDGAYYHVPIAFLEPDLRYTFNGQINIKIKSFREYFGSIVIHVRLKVFHPVYKLWQCYDGIAATPIQSIIEGEWKNTTKLNQIDEMKTGVPAAYSTAVQNAAKKIGKRFGSDVNRMSTPANKGKQKPDEEKKKQHFDERITMLIDGAENLSELNEVLPHIGDNEEYEKAFNKKLNSLKKPTKKK